MFIQRKKSVRANEEVVSVAPEATELLFEAEDVAELVAEVTGQDVEVSAEGEAVTFSIGEEDFTVEAEGTEEFVESSTRMLRGKKAVAASTNRVKQKNDPGRTVKKFSPSAKR